MNVVRALVSVLEMMGKWWLVRLWMTVVIVLTLLIGNPIAFWAGVAMLVIIAIVVAMGTLVESWLERAEAAESLEMSWSDA